MDPGAVVIVLCIGAVSVFGVHQALMHSYLVGQVSFRLTVAEAALGHCPCTEHEMHTQPQDKAVMFTRLHLCCFFDLNSMSYGCHCDTIKGGRLCLFGFVLRRCRFPMKSTKSRVALSHTWSRPQSYCEDRRHLERIKRIIHGNT